MTPSPAPTPSASPSVTPTITPSPTPTATTTGTTPPASATSTVALSSAGGTIALPVADGSGGSIVFTSNNAPPGTVVTFVHTVDPNPRASYQPHFLTLRFSSVVTFSKFSPVTYFALGAKFQPYATMYGGYQDSTTNTSIAGGGAAPVCNDSAYVAPGSAAYTVVPSDTYAVYLNSDEVIPTPPAGSPTCPPM